MSLDPLVSIVIPTYNRGALISNAIRSALSQDYKPIEIIVIDDGSTDDTESIVKEFPGIKYVKQDHKGQAAARNNGWKHSSGIYFATLDSDDTWDSNFISICVAQLEKHQLDFVFANWEQERKEGGLFDFFSEDPLLIPYLPNAIDSWVMLDYAALRYLYVRGCPSPSSSMVLRSSSIVSGWNEEMNIADDWCMLIDMIMARKAKAAFTTQLLWSKHINCGNIYDGRDHIEVNKLLYVLDTQVILDRHAKSLTKAEHSLIEKRYLRNLVRSAKHSLFTYANFKESARLMKIAVRTNPLYATKIFSQLFLQAGKRQFKKDIG